MKVFVHRLGRIVEIDQDKSRNFIEIVSWSERDSDRAQLSNPQLSPNTTGWSVAGPKGKVCPVCKGTGRIKEEGQQTTQVEVDSGTRIPRNVSPYASHQYGSSQRTRCEHSFKQIPGRKDHGKLNRIGVNGNRPNGLEFVAGPKGKICPRCNGTGRA